MKLSATGMPRRVTSAEERELLAIAQKLQRAKANVDDLRAERDQLIADLLHANARISDIAEILELTHKAVRDARDRARSS